MEVRAISKNQRVQPRKVRIIADEIRGKSALHAAGLLRYHPSKGARVLRKVLISAIANAAENNGLSPESLTISTIMVDEGPKMKRMIAKAMGRGGRINKKTSHITVGVEEADEQKVVKPHGTKAKPRPTFAAPTRGKKAAAGKKLAAVAEPVDEVTDTDVETVIAAEPEEAMPVTASDAPEEGGSAAPIEEPAGSTDEEDNK